MTKEEIKAYIEKNGNARETIDAVKALMAEGIPITESNLTERLTKTVKDDIDDLPDLISIPKTDKKASESSILTDAPKPRPVYKQPLQDALVEDLRKQKMQDFVEPPIPNVYSSEAVRQNNSGAGTMQGKPMQNRAAQNPQQRQKVEKPNNVQPAIKKKASPALIPMIILQIVSLLMVGIGSALSDWVITKTAAVSGVGGSIHAELLHGHPLMWIGFLFVLVLSIVVNWRIYTKAGEGGWKILIPFYNSWTLYKIIFGRGAAMFRLFIPFYNFYWLIKTYICLGRVFGKKGGFNVGMVFLPNIFETILAFGSAEYIGPEQK